MDDPNTNGPPDPMGELEFENNKLRCENALLKRLGNAVANVLAAYDNVKRLEPYGIGSLARGYVVDWRKVAGKDEFDEGRGHG